MRWEKNIGIRISFACDERENIPLYNLFFFSSLKCILFFFKKNMFAMENEWRRETLLQTEIDQKMSIHLFDKKI